MPTIRSWALTRGYALHPGTRNRYEIGYTRTQHRPASRQVNDHGRVSGTHTHPNACLTCPDFQTTPAFLDIHRRQRDETRLLIATAEADGRFRLADNHRQVHDNLDGLIAALEDIGDTTP